MVPGPAAERRRLLDTVLPKRLIKIEMYSYIWIEGEKNLDEFCMKRFGERPHFMETIGRVSGKGAFAKVHLIYKYPAEDEPPYSGCHEMYFLYMEHNSGKFTFYQLEEIMRWTYEQIRIDKTAILRVGK